LNNRIEQSHRKIKRKAKHMIWFESFKSAQITLIGTEIALMIRKGQCSLMELFVSDHIKQWQYLADLI